ncbi:lysine--tRNA ligase, partial [Anaerolinea sp.]|uniref:lysine--tRNA ligase n=1 Tax=Anaerolinea sp. TaxID=1872519 RepID=UPI002ACD9E18
MNFSELERIRVEKIERMRARGIDPYPTRAEVTHTTVQAIQLYEQAESAGSSDPVQVSVGGRLRAIRTMGKVTFAHIEDGWGRLQLFFRVNELGEAEMERFRDDFDLGDFIQASGVMFRTRSGEISLHVHAFKMLSKAITPLPAAKDEVVDGKVIRHAALTDPETRYRQRYADLAVNPEVREVFRIRARAVKALRDYLDNMGFLEVETPILQPIYGGAAARPFVTYHNQLKQNLYLRISFELYLKRLLVGMLDRVYEIGRDFRNEGVSYKHNPEFTQLEFYMAYADYLQVMEITEQMVAYVAQQVLGTTTITYEGNTIDLTPPWRRLELRQGILETTGIDIDQHPTAESLAEAMRAKGMQPKPGYSRGKLIDSLLGDYLEPTLIQPTFLYNYPRDISPLAKSMPGNPLITERFEGYIGGMELCNAFTELNDPLDQEQRFLEMGRDYNADDEERHPMDEDYLRAMSYGMPPCGGFGMGIDRLVMLLADRHTIREVIL